VSIHTRIERVLESHGVTIQNYHGGHLTGGAILVLLDNHQIIMDDIASVCHEFINKHLESNLCIPCPTIDYINDIIDEHCRLFQAQDAVYSHLRIIDPTRIEMQQTRENIDVMKKLWNKMELSITPKAHLIFFHAANDQLIYGGLGDKIEDPLEKRHQEQMRLDSILNKMSCSFHKKMLTQYKYEWRNSNPLVLDRIDEVKLRTSRKRKADDVELPSDQSIIMKQERQQRRIDYVNDIKNTYV
jgi:hypothetical protein